MVVVMCGLLMGAASVARADHGHGPLGAYGYGAPWGYGAVQQGYRYERERYVEDRGYAYGYGDRWVTPRPAWNAYRWHAPCRRPSCGICRAPRPRRCPPPVVPPCTYGYRVPPLAYGYPVPLGY